MTIVLIKQDHFTESKWAERENEDKQLLQITECSLEGDGKEANKSEAGN